VGQVLQLDPIGEKRHPGLQNSPRSPEHFFDQPGTGGTPHSPDPKAEVEAEAKVKVEVKVKGWGRAGGFRPFSLSFAGIQRFNVWGDDPGSDAGPVELGIPEVLRFTSRLVGEDQKNLLTSGAAEMVDLPAYVGGDA